MPDFLAYQPDCSEDGAGFFRIADSGPGRHKKIRKKRGFFLDFGEMDDILSNRGRFQARFILAV